MNTLSQNAIDKITSIQSIIGQDDGNRGMKALIVPDDLCHAAVLLARLPAGSNILILSGFPCCVDQSPPTETDGPPGAIAIAQAALALGMNVALVTDDCNEIVFRAAGDKLSELRFEIFPPDTDSSKAAETESRMGMLVENKCNLIISCERAGPSKDGACRTMRGINMNAKGLIAPIHRIIGIAREWNDKNPSKDGKQYIAIGDGGNELGMGKVLDHIRNNPMIPKGDEIGAVTTCDHLIAASVSNWGGYALSAACAIVKNHDSLLRSDDSKVRTDWVEKCVPIEKGEIDLLERCVKVGCRDGVSGRMECTVDGMPLETSLSCLRRIRRVAKE
mmetsp:Transcript_30206/g.46211  ORF Transcript_30206/g.46211 Transcript_30206/m.46211 type:complete len:333 (-) Transcript_30206:1662-2660(-)